MQCLLDVSRDVFEWLDRLVWQAFFTNVTCIDAMEVRQPSHHAQAASLAGYALKVFALYATSFEEVLLLDCDSMPTRNPQQLFNSVEFR